MNIESSKYKCIACGSNVQLLRDFGSQILTNYLPASADEALRQHPIMLGICRACHLTQLCDLCPPSKLIPPRPMHYDEPEAHLDDLVAQLIKLPNMTQASRICGVTYKEVSTLKRLDRLGFSQQVALSPADDFEITNECAGLETLQSIVTQTWADSLVKRRGAFDVVLVRHMLEHAQDLHEFLHAVRTLMSQDGYIVFEVPDCATMFQKCDYSFLWEEHASYFTPDTLVHTLRRHQLDPVQVVNYPRALENSLVVIARQATESMGRSEFDLPIDKGLAANNYAGIFQSVKDRWHATLDRLRCDGPVAILGMGHLAIMFVNLLELESKIDLVCDDHPDKIGRYVPGTALQIETSSKLVDQSARTCLMAVAPESEKNVRERNREFIDRGGQFASIFAASDLALQLDSP